MPQGPPEPFLLGNIQGITIVKFLNAKLGTDVRDALYELIEKHGHRQVILDFENVRVLTSAPIGILINLKNKAEAVGGSVRLSRLAPDVREILRLTSVESLFRIFDTEQDAIDSFSAS
jgi:anti-anti-sigma factor